eukprot:TRINITY_DN1903_c0_g1_i1.p1 TRINITY_DN1903_c0_g1~~TRINITY_DN1903_c0_g1_i1.p1  ORF type:complete len:661 (+),score=162.41 TRINITY_DN1903_c0_g1_i1:318-2300(+)
MSWFWKSDLRAAPTNAAAWTAYSATDNEIIEKAWAKKKIDVALNNTYTISFGDMIQFRNDDYTRQRPVKREGGVSKYAEGDKANSKKRKEPEGDFTDASEEITPVTNNLNQDLRNRFATPFDRDYSDLAATLVEKTYIKVLNLILRKPDWNKKRQDESIWAKWQAEIMAQINANVPPPAHAWMAPQTPAPLDDEHWNYMQQELEWIAKQKEGALERTAMHAVWQADHLVPKDLKQELQTGVAVLENVPESARDWHPGSRQQVLDLVHPSLYPLVYGVTRVLTGGRTTTDSALKHMGGGRIIESEIKKSPPKKHKPQFYDDDMPDDNYSMSNQFAWLPAEFDVDKQGAVKILSYINNLHPIKHKALYGTIAKVFEKFVPLFNKTLSELASASPGIRFYPPEKPRRDEDDDDYDPQYAPVKVGNFSPRKLNNVDLRGRRLQVIVKLANIILTPENPTYDGGVWHVEGMLNENIVASGIYYYHSENISESLLNFRRSCSSPADTDYDEDGTEHGYVGHYWGLDNGEALNQEIGGVVTQEDRCIAFPNVFQHQVQPFQLVDKTKPGVRKILVFFLVDPSHRVISTETVPPQQQSWYTDALRRNIPFFWRLPKEIVDHISSFTSESPMSFKEAKKHRKKLMEERKYFVDVNSAHVFEREFNLCEH